MATPASVFLLVGPEEGEKQEFIQNIKDDYLKAHKDTPESYRFYAGQPPAGDIVSILQNGSLFSSYKFVTLANIEQLKKTEVQQLSDYLKHPEKSATLFLVTHEYKAPSAFTKVVPKGQQKTFFELFENKKREWLLKYFRKAELAIDEDAVEMVLELVENNTLEMKNAADKLILYFGPGSRLTGDDIEEFIYHSKEENVFSLFQKIVQQDLPAALEILHKILLSGQSNGVQILGGLLWQFRRLLKLSRMLDRRFSPEEAMRAIPIRGKRNQQNYLQASRTFTTRQLEQIIAVIRDFDGQVRQHRAEVERLLVEFSLLKIGAKSQLNHTNADRYI